jgi:hypothetical protein
MLFPFCLALLTTVLTAAGETNQPAAAPPAFTVKLRYGKEIALAQPDAQTLYSNAVRLLKSSNFNSSKSARVQMHWDPAKVADDYRFTVAGSYLLVSFKEPQDVHTAGGNVIVRDIVIALKEEYGHRSELFTVDDDARIIAHGKYSGPIIVELLNLAKKLAKDP